MGSQVLVVNSSYMPVNAIHWKKAVGLIFSKKAELIVADDKHVLRSPTFEICKPIVIRLTRYNKIPVINIKFNKKNVFLRDNFTCQYCGKKLPSYDLTIDHVIPRKHGGKSNWENVVACCVDCNAKKSEFLLQHTKMSLLSIPKKPYYSQVILIRRCASKEDLEKWRDFFFI